MIVCVQICKCINPRPPNVNEVYPLLKKNYNFLNKYWERLLVSPLKWSYGIIMGLFAFHMLLLSKNVCVFQYSLERVCIMCANSKVLCLQLVAAFLQTSSKPFYVWQKKLTIHLKIQQSDSRILHNRHGKDYLVSSQKTLLE